MLETANPTATFCIKKSVPLKVIYCGENSHWGLQHALTRVAWQPSETQPLLPGLPSVFKLHGQQVHLSINFQPHFANHLGSEFSILLNLDELGIFGPTRGFFLNHLNLTNQPKISTASRHQFSPSFTRTFLMIENWNLKSFCGGYIPISKPSFPVTSVLVHQPK